MRGKLYPVVLLVALLFSFIHINPVSAAPKLEVKAEAGISNKVKYNTPLPLKMTITNNGSAFSGDLVIDAAESYAMGSGLVYPLDIAEGETKTLQLYLNGLTDQYLYNNQQRNMFYFYEGGIEEGELVAYKGAKVVRPQFYEPTGTFIYTLTENSDRLSAFQKLRQYASGNVEVFHVNQLKDFQFPTEAKGLGMANVIAVDEVSLTDYSEQQQQALYNWVNQGGTLLIGASDQVEATAGIFKEYLPLMLSSEKVRVSKEYLTKSTADGNFTEDIQVYKAQAKEDSVRLLADGNSILAASQSLSSGQVVQTTFSLGDQPLSSMDGYAKLIAAMLDLKSINQNNSFGMHYGSVNDYLPNEVGNINELFPSFEVKTTALIVTVIIYIILVGPLLYFILKRMDKREHAWWIIPLLSIALSVGMFMFGAKDRLMQSQIQQSAFYKVEGENLTGHYVESILTNRGGDFIFEMDENTTAVASNNSYSYSNPADTVLHEKTYVTDHASGSAIHFRNLNYWSVQSMVGQTTIENAGKMDIQLTLKDGEIEGAITNHFPFKLNDVAILSGSKEIELGDIEANGTLQVSKEIKNSVLLSPAISNYAYTQPQSKKDLMPVRLEKLKYGAIGLSQDEKAPVIAAWTDKALVGIELDGSAEVSPLAYIVQSFDPTIELTGEFTLNHETLESSLDPTSGSGYMELINEAANEWYLDNGEYDLSVWVPDELLEDTAWTEVSLSNRAANFLEVAIWNWSTSAYEEMQESSATYSENLKQYISPEGQLKMRIRKKDDMGTPVKMPNIEVKGVAGP
ncbi:hypothetical protein D1B33_17675 [Lysinibacillus yapensis]|uniref:DUF4350 domain-containing protein n=1 Tax=Ureibacillus yapensis TaxID=2304605 RepID=A0A396S2N0_9BACL|nr:hypothetical protein [Lysinibacillus yapensis]RHW31453.1 hypothetical protein D1B33_17675 [Lysinibacillus yapensis]